MEHIDANVGMFHFMYNFDIFRCRKSINKLMKEPIQEIPEQDYPSHEKVLIMSYVSPGNAKHDWEIPSNYKRSLENTFHIETKFFLPDEKYIELFNKTRLDCQSLLDRLSDNPVSPYLKLHANFVSKTETTIALRLIEQQKIPNN